MTYEEVISISNSLQLHNSIFYIVWKLMKQVENPEVGTCAVTFDKSGQFILFQYNPEYWNNLTEYNKCFIICHECLHILLNHGQRLIHSKNSNIANIAHDLSINQQLLKMGFEREKVTNHNNLCWIDTVFKDEEFRKTVLPNKNSEYYYELLTKNQDQMQDGWTTNDHSYLSDVPDDIKGQICDDIQDTTLSDSDIDAIEGLSELDASGDEGQLPGGTFAGTIAGSLKKIVIQKKQRLKRSLESVLKNIIKNCLKMDLKDKEQWARQCRRLQLINSEFFIPSEMEVDDYEKDKVIVSVYIDTSGSCYGYTDRFIKFTKSIPEDKFEVHAFCFDTRVYNIDIKKEKVTLYGFGGTSFSCIESSIQKNISNKTFKRYPNCVIVLTDGYGNRVSPQIQKNWFFFLTNKYTECVPPNSTSVLLSDFI